MVDILAIDLAGSEKQNTGIAYLKDNKIVTKTLKTDKEILKIISYFKPKFVAIDAPLSLPKGRKTIDQKNKNHFRDCDLELKKLKIKFFPITLGPMRQLTKRGISLKAKLEERGIKVYEMFPGASLDLLGIERKNIEKVKDFLEPFAVNPKNIDESDAAIGLFTLWLFVQGLGKTLKGKIIVPNPAIKLGILEEAELLERENRFVLKIKIKGKIEKAYLRDTGKLPKYVFKGNKVYVVKYLGKFKYMVKAINNPETHKLVMVDSFLDNKLVFLYYRQQGVILESKNTKKGDSIFDFKLDNNYIEVKGASLIEKNIAYFPDTFSKRAVKHFSELSSNDIVIFVAHSPVKYVKINKKYNVLEELLADKNTFGLSTRIVNGYWVLEKEIKTILPNKF